MGLRSDSASALVWKIAWFGSMEDSGHGISSILPVLLPFLKT